MQGEVWEILQSKLQTASEAGFCCLVAEAAARPAGIVGIIEVSVQSEKVCNCQNLSGIGWCSGRL